MTLNQLAALILFFFRSPRGALIHARDVYAVAINWDQQRRAAVIGGAQTPPVLRGGHVVDEFTDIATTIYIICCEESRVPAREHIRCNTTTAVRKSNPVNSARFGFILVWLFIFFFPREMEE